MKKSYQEHCKSIAQFREDIENYETKAKLATDKMYKNREPLSRADLELHKDCENIIVHNWKQCGTSKERIDMGILNLN